MVYPRFKPDYAVFKTRVCPCVPVSKPPFLTVKQWGFLEKCQNWKIHEKVVNFQKSGRFNVIERRKSSIANSLTGQRLVLEMIVPKPPFPE